MPLGARLRVRRGGDRPRRFAAASRNGSFRPESGERGRSRRWGLGSGSVDHGEIVSFIWGVADLIRDTFKRGKYQDVILPLTVLRRLDCVLAPTQGEGARAARPSYGARASRTSTRSFARSSGFAFYNTSRYDFEKLLADAPNLAANLRNYIAGFSPNMREVLEKFDFDNTISKLDEAGLLFQVLERFKNVDLHPDQVDNPTMGTIFEELIRKFNEALNENPGEHFTPRDVVHLMVDLDARRRRGATSGARGVVCTVYDPCCGSGGMLMITKEHITVGLRKNGDLLRGRDQPGCGNPPLRAGSESRDLGRFEVRPLHEGPDRARRRQHRLRQHPSNDRHAGKALRLPDRQSALRQGLEGRRGRGARRARARVRPVALRRDSRASATASSSSCCTCSRT